MPARTRRRPAGTSSNRPRLVGYIRVSTEEQAAEGLSLTAQRERLKAYATAHDADLVAVHRDSCSGKIPPERRSGLANALAALKAGKADGLVVLKLDRLSRSTRHVLDLVDSARKREWRLISVSEQLDTGTAAGRLVVTVLAALAEMEREQVGERTRLALEVVAREGRGRSRFTPFGWRTADGAPELTKGDIRRLVKHREEQALLRRILRARAGGLGARRIARRLNGSGSPNPRTGQAWTPETVATVLRSYDRREQVLAG